VPRPTRCGAGSCPPRRPGGKIYIIPITEPITLVLKGQEGNHPEFVFTFEAKRNDRQGHRQGRRYPLTHHVVRYYWEALRLGKRWHDVRHTFGTRLYGISKDIHLVQRAMKHSNVATTMKYVHTNREDVREAMEKLPFRKVNGPSANEHSQDKFGQTCERGNSPAKTKWCGREDSNLHGSPR